MTLEIYCQACEKAIHESETNYEIRQCAKVNGDVCPTIEFGFFHAACAQPDQNQSEE
jgi:hypothetical protein